MESTEGGKAPAQPKKRGNKKGAPRPRIARPLPALADEDALWDAPVVCQFFGGLDLATVYRGIAEGRYPHPVRVSPGRVRWLRSECRAARQKLVDARPVSPKPEEAETGTEAA